MEQFISKNLKWFTIGFMCLFLFKCGESCNRKMKITKNEKEYNHVVDSLNNQILISSDSIKKLNFELVLLNDKVKSANEKVSAIQSAVEKIKTNTTVVVKNNDENKK